MAKRSPTPLDEAKINEACSVAIAQIEHAREEGKLPILMILVSPYDGFEEAELVAPEHMDARQVARFILESLLLETRK